MTPINDTEFITPLELPFTLPDGREVMVSAAPIQRLGLMLKHCRPMIDEIAAMPLPMLKRLQKGEPEADDISWLFELMSDRCDSLIELVSVGSAVPLALVQGMMPDRFMYLFALVVQVNADFFARAAPLLKAAFERLVEAAKPVRPDLPNVATSTGLRPSTA